MMSLRRLSCCLVGFMVISLAVSNLHAQRGGGRFGGGFGGFGGGGFVVSAAVARLSCWRGKTCKRN